MDDVGMESLAAIPTKSLRNFGLKRSPNKERKNCAEDSQSKKIQKTDGPLSAEQKFDAIFGAPAKGVFSETTSSPRVNNFRFSETVKDAVDEPVNEPVVETKSDKNTKSILPTRSKRIANKNKQPTKKTDNESKIDSLTRIKPKKTAKLEVSPSAKRFQISNRSPFALAFGTVESDEEEDDEFGDNDFDSKGVDQKNASSAEQCWDEMMHDFDDPPKKKGIKLSALARKDNTSEDTIETEDDRDRSLTEDPFDNFDEDIPSVGIKTSVEPPVPAPSPDVQQDVKEEMEDNTKKKPVRERRFFKNRTKARPVNYQYQIHTNVNETDDVTDTFKKPCLPGPSQTSTTINSLPITSVSDLVIPVTERLSDEQSHDAELADDVTYYLEGVKSSQDVCSRALSALGFAKRCSDDGFRKFLASKKLSKKHQAHNLGQYVVLQLLDASKPSYTTHSFALATAIALHKTCIDKQIGCSKFVLALVVKLLRCELPTNKTDQDSREFGRMQAQVADLMKGFKTPKDGWNHKTVASETVTTLCSVTTKPIFNAICLISGILEHVTHKLIRLIDVKTLDEVDKSEFDRIFKAFTEQTKAPYLRSQEFVATKTDLFKTLGKFLNMTNGKEDLREGGYADLITMHLISMCGVSEVVCHALSQCDFTGYILRMLGPLSAQMDTYTERKHVRKVGVAVLLNLVAKSPSTRTQLQRTENLHLVCEVFLEEKEELQNVHDGNVSLNMNRTSLMQQFDQTELNMMTDDEAVQMGQLVSKVDKHVAGCLTIGYAAMIFAQLIKANEFIMPKVRQKLDDESFKFSLDCLDEIENILKMSGKEDENSQKMIQEARDTYQKFGFE